MDSRRRGRVGRPRDSAGIRMSVVVMTSSGFRIFRPPGVAGVHDHLVRVDLDKDALRAQASALLKFQKYWLHVAERVDEEIPVDTDEDQRHGADHPARSSRASRASRAAVAPVLHERPEKISDGRTPRRSPRRDRREVKWMSSTTRNPSTEIVCGQSDRAPAGAPGHPPAPGISRKGQGAQPRTGPAIMAPSQSARMGSVPRAHRQGERSGPDSLRWREEGRAHGRVPRGNIEHEQEPVDGGATALAEHRQVSGSASRSAGACRRAAMSAASSSRHGDAMSATDCRAVERSTAGTTPISTRVSADQHAERARYGAAFPRPRDVGHRGNLGLEDLLFAHAALREGAGRRREHEHPDEVDEAPVQPEELDLAYHCELRPRRIPAGSRG